jgi:hypothetical protein
MPATTKIVAAGKVAAMNGTSWTCAAAVCRASEVNCRREMFGEMTCAVQTV